MTDSLNSFLTELVDYSQHSLQSAQSADDQSRLQHTLTSLAIARACLARLALQRDEDHPSHPLQVVVAGPTQTGKSTLVNLLLQEALALSSAQAGFTVHCQGFHVVDTQQNRYDESDHWASEYFTGLLMAEQSTLDPQALGEYSLQETVVASSDFGDIVVWDTPDFDSVRAFDYRAPLVKALVLADLLVFVVSKEKYADNTVWMMFELLTELSLPFVVVMNKTPPAVREELKASFDKKFSALQSRKSGLQIQTPSLLFLDEFKGDVLESVSSEERDSLQALVLEKLSRDKSAAYKDKTLTYLRTHWPAWTAGISAEHRKRREYEDLVEKVCADTLQRYRSEYIDSDRHREVMQLALSELLVLLEIPGMAKPLGKIRSVVTWPVRTLMSSARSSPAVLNDDRNEERRLLDELGKHAIGSLSTAISQHETGADENWWRGARDDLGSAETDLVARYSQGLDNYQTLLQVEIDRAAQSLYKRLQQQPATLNGLRAARVTTDAAAVVLAVKSGGLGAVDLVVAPAMLSLTSLLTEGALGQYLNRIQAKLTAYQEREVQSIVERKLRRPFLQLARSDRTQSLSEQKLQQMTRLLESGDV